MLKHEIVAGDENLLWKKNKKKENGNDMRDGRGFENLNAKPGPQLLCWAQLSFFSGSRNQKRKKSFFTHRNHLKLVWILKMSAC